ncbi:MAG: thiamine pyrophosphate-dependent dehydrogenase E1 component subunit alpha [Candidatus Omnitrophota bacterium]|jgi:pyruvate dehydrogenase E1 component alpha subunit
MNDAVYKQIYLSMLRIRFTEEKIVDVYGQQTMRTPTHLSIGQEAVAAAVCQALRPDDQVFVSHRCHAAYLARGGDLEAFFSELCGRVTGTSRGRAGSAHLSSVDKYVFASPILGSMIPVAVGAALSFTMDQKDRISVALFGDAAVEEGVFAESLNFAVLKKLPVLFICENNTYSTHSPLRVRQPSSAIYERVRIPELPAFQIDGNDAVGLYETVSGLVSGVRQGGGPVFVECLTYRIREHVGPLYDYDRGYRDREEVESWMKRCPLKRMETYLLGQGILTADDVALLRRDCQAQADAAYAAALNSGWPAAEELRQNIY